MHVYERRPNGLSPQQLLDHARSEPRAAAFAAVRGVGGIVLMGLLTAPLGWLWFVLGVASLSSVFVFVRSAAEAAIRRPALVLTGRPKWDGTRRTSWSIDAADPVEVARELAGAVDAELGDSLTAFDEESGHRGATRNEVFVDPSRSAVIAWSVGGGRPRLAAVDDVVGVWLRVDREEGGAAAVMLLASEGPAVEALLTAARRCPVRPDRP